MTTKFETSVQFLLDPADGFAVEGGYVNDPKDPGGETKFGISKRAHPTLDIKNLTMFDAMDIYHREYWLANNIDQYDLPFCIAVLDSYVQHSPKAARAMIQLAEGNLQSLLNSRREYYLRLIDRKPELGRFKKGWLNRVNELSKYCEIVRQEELSR